MTAIITTIEFTVNYGDSLLNALAITVAVY